MKTRLILPLALLLAASALAAAPELDRAAAALPGTQAQFTQRFTPKGFTNSQVESGSVIFGTLPMMRWSYASPESKLFVFDGTKSWFYVPADRQVTVTQLDAAHRRELPFLLIGDPAARDRYFVVSESRRGNAVVTTLQPRDGGAMIRNIAVTIAPTTHFIERVDYTDREGNRTSFEFAGFQKKSAGAETFRFSPPAGVQVVQGQ